MIGSAVPRVLGVGDVHLENFGTWRDVEGRLTWGVNDLDEVAVMPYTNDLVRLTASALLANLDIADPCSVVFDGYRNHLRSRSVPRPFVLAERNTRVSAYIRQNQSVRKWWQDYLKGVRPLPSRHRPALTTAQTALADSFLDCAPADLTFSTRRAGLGSLGRPRVVAVGHWRGSLAGREAKAMLPSAWAWHNGPESGTPTAAALMSSAARAVDPHARLHDGWLIRSVGPDHHKVDATRLGSAAAQRRMLRSMGAEVANLHWVGSRTIGTGEGPVLEHLEQVLAVRSGGLAEAAHIMADAVRTDRKEYAKSRTNSR